MVIFENIFAKIMNIFGSQDLTRPNRVVQLIGGIRVLLHDLYVVSVSG